MQDFFIKRPIFASVIAIIITLAGAISIPLLPVSEYPNISPPVVSVSANYTGASAEVVESAVTTPLEQQINGSQGIKYINSTSGNDGNSTIRVTFDLERDIDLAAVDIQSRVSTVEGRLPEDTRRTGISITKSNSTFVLAIGLSSKDNRYDSQFLSNYADMYIKDALKRVKGVGNVEIFGERKYSMRIWLDPNKLVQHGLTPMDVVKAVSSQNIQVAAGQIGQAPSPLGQSYQLSVKAKGRLSQPSQFENIVIKATKNGTLVKLKDIASVELGAETYGTIVRYKSQDSVGLGIFLRPGGNAMEVSQGVREEMKKIAKRFPAGLEYDFAFDTTASVKESIKEVLYTLSQAILLVIIVIFVFLQNPRSTIIPAITIPVSLIGTFLFMKAFGFSINTLTLFGITLATGLVVDDAIVVIENINRYIEEKNMKPMEAASVAMAEVTGPVIAISLVLSAVFIPVAFFPGTVGQLYKQFALTIAFSVLISTINALTLTPALSGQWLKHEDEEKKNYFFRQFDKFMTWLRNSYGQSLKTVLRFKELTMIFFVASLFATYWLFKTIPTAFVPNEDQGYFITLVQCPEGSSLEYTKKVVQEVEKEMDKIPEILSVFGIAGFSFSGNGSNNGILFANLKDWRYRRSHESSLNGVINKLRAPLGLITGGTVIPFNPPPIEGLGSYGGFVFKVLDLYGSDINMLAKSTTDLCRVANQQKDLRGVFSSFNANSPQLIVDVNRDLAESLHIPVNEIFNTLEIFLGSWYVNDFDFLNRIYRVYVQADKNFRSNPNNIDQFYVRSLDGKMVPISNLITTQKTTSPQTIMHYNLFRSTEINGSPAPGYSSGQAMQIMADLADKNLPKGLSYAWSGISLEEEESGTKALVIFVLGLVFVFLVLAAQYESLFDPLIIILSVPLAMLGALLAQWLRGLENDIFCQIGLVMLIGLASKNAILIVEFANKLHEKGKPLEEAVVEASTIRLRPILMTSLAFIMGIIPLVFAHGAGAGARNSLGTAVFGGMIVSSILSLYIVPVIYLYISRIREYFRLKRRN